MAPHVVKWTRKLAGKQDTWKGRLGRIAHWIGEPTLLLQGHTTALGFLLLFAVLVGYGLGNQLELMHDSGVYVALAYSLVSGEGYREIYEVGVPPHTKYPPVFPLLLAFVVYVFDVNFWAMRLLIAGLGVVALYAIYLFFRRLAGHKVALTVLVLTGVSPGIWFYSQSILSEIPYLLVSFVSLFCLEKYKDQQGHLFGNGLIAALTLGVTSLTRTIGVALLVGGVAYLALEGTRGERFCARRRAMKSALLAVIGGIPAVLWFVRNWVVSNGTTPVAYLQEYGLKDYAYADSGITEWRDLYELIHHNLYIYTITSAKIIFPYLAWIPEKSIIIIILLTIFLGFLICLIKKRTILEYYIPPYICALLLFPASYSRYLIPLIPIVWYYFLTFLERLIQRWTIKPAPVYWTVVTLLIGFSLTFSVQIGILKNDTNDYHVDVKEMEYINILPWVQENTDASSVFMWSKPSLRYLIVKRKAASIPTTSDRERVLGRIQNAGVNYVVIDGFSDGSQRYVKPVIDEHPEIFSPIYQNGTSMVFKVIR
jgi:4-amino-4-deoxy-L-arabinose transferase-like glycosyltransferase